MYILRKASVMNIKEYSINKRWLLRFCIILCLYSRAVNAADFDDLLLHRADASQPFFKNSSKGIKWMKHQPVPEGPVELDGEADYRGQIDIGEIDLDGDKKNETIKAIWGEGVTDHFLTIEIYSGDTLISTLKNDFGIQPNYKIADVDKDGKKEMII